LIRQQVSSSPQVLVIERCGLRWFGFGSRFQPDRGAQPSDRDDLGQRHNAHRILPGAPGDHADLIECHPPSRMSSAQRGNSASRPATAMIVWALAGEQPVFQATNVDTDRTPVMPHSPSRSISAAISTMRPSIALR
jgi:hypothetical protein